MTTTQVYKVDAREPDEQLISKAARIIRRGGTVAFPTETVYGLGANALNDEAVQQIFEAKGRPGDNPLIVHVAELEQVFELAAEVPLNARRAMEAFWPGPLTVVLPALPTVPRVVTGGLDTVAVRMPSHPVALAILKAAGVPVAAPSANSSGKPSPTEAAHVIEDLSGKIDAIVDGGPTEVGLESTVLDMTGDPPVILRPGGVPQEQLESVLGHLDVDTGSMDLNTIPRSPGMKYRHYSPAARLILVKEAAQEVVLKDIAELAARYQAEGLKVALMVSRETAEKVANKDLMCGVLGSRQDLSEVAGSLFRVLRELDAQQPDVIVAESFPEHGLGKALMNRLTKAAAEIVSLN